MAYQWDYIKQRNAFYDMAADNLTALEERLYNRLFNENNLQNRLEWFIMSNTRLALVAGMEKPNMIRVRNSLAQKGLIEFKTGKKKGEPTNYKLRVLYDTQNNTQNKIGYYGDTQFNTQNNTQNNTQFNTQFNTQNNTQFNTQNNTQKFFKQNTDEPNNDAACEGKKEQKNGTFPTKDLLKEKEKVKGKGKDKYIPPNPPKGGEVDIFAKAAEGDVELLQAFDDFAEFRKSIKKPLTDKAKALLVKRLDELAKTPKEKVQIIEQSILHGWQSVYELERKGGNMRGENRGGGYAENIRHPKIEGADDFDEADKHQRYPWDVQPQS